MLLSEQRHSEGAGRSARCAAAVLFTLAANTSWAQAPAVTILDKVVITGSHIRQTEIEGALPVQIITREEIERSGVTTVEQLLERVPANVNAFTQALTVGNSTNPGLSGANLRGLGGGSTLVLLNGRRLSNYAFDGETVDLNAIPFAAIERVEILKDGASAIYGTDAIAGVINFILRKDYQGAEISGSFAATQHGGGNSGQASAVYGFGDPARDGYNVFGVVNYQKEHALRALDRDFARTAYRPDLGINNLNGITFPANIVDRPGRRILNPTYANGCAPPASVPFLVPPFFTAGCGYDYATAIDLLPEVERLSAMLRGSLRVAPEIDLFAEAVAGRNRFDAQIAPVAIPAVQSAFGPVLYPAGGPYYPTAFAAANGLSGSLLIPYRAIELGPRKNSTTSEMQRYVLGAEGALAGWDFNLAAVYSASSQEQEYVSGYVYFGRFIPAMRTGLINPFGPSAPEGQALLASTEYRGTPQTADGSTSLVNAYASREIAQLPAGPLALALGAEGRRERLSYDWDPAVLTGDSPVGDQLQSISGSRNVNALFAELNVPIVRGLDAQLAVRYDDYSDFGSTTNPKVALRWHPLPTVLVRGSWGEGFRAPPLYSLNDPTTIAGVTAGIVDPIRCPVTGSLDDCFGVVQVYSGGNPSLQPETSTQWNFGIVWEPVRGLSFGVDYWNVEQEGVIAPLGEENLFRYYETFSSRVTRGPVDPMYPGLPGPIVAIDTSLINLGTTQTSGVDVSVAWAAPRMDWGQVRVALQGTYVRQWDTQFDGVTYVSQLGTDEFGAAIPRWRSLLTLNWNDGPWGATLAQNYTAGYTDFGPGPSDEPRAVGAFAPWDIQGTYTGFAGWRLAAGVRNLFDKDPPASNQGTTFQVGYDPQVANPLGRVFYLRASYTFN